MDLGCYNLKETCLSDINLEILTRKMSKNNNYMHNTFQHKNFVYIVSMSFVILYFLIYVIKFAFFFAIYQ